MPGWDSNAATFEMTIAANGLHGDYQIANGYGHDKAKEVLTVNLNNITYFSIVVSPFIHPTESPI